MIQTTAPALLAAVNGAASKLSTRHTGAFAAHVAIDSRAVNATDLEIDSTQWYAASGDADAFHLDRAALKRILAKIGDAPITLAAETGGACILASPRGAFTLAQMPAADWPNAQPAPTDDAPLEVPADTLRNMLERSLVAASKDETRPVLTGVLLARGDDGFELVGCDSYRLHVLAHGTTSRDDGRRSLMPRKFAEAVVERIKKLKPPTVTIAADSADGGRGHVRVQVGDWTGSCRLIQGSYLNYRSLFPEGAAATAVLPAADMIAAIDLAEAIAPRTNTILKLRVGPGECSLAADSKTGAAFAAPLNMLYEIQADHASHAARKDAARMAGDVTAAIEGMTIGYNGAFLADMIAAAQSDSPILSMISPLRPSWISSVGCAQCGTPIDGHGVAFTGLLMPIRLG